MKRKLLLLLSFIFVMATLPLHAYESSIASGSYYRLYSASYTTLCMDGAGGAVAGVTADANSYSQMWKITKSGSTYTFQNVLTNQYIQAARGTSVQFLTGTSSANFTGTTSGSGTSTKFAFYSGSGTSSYTALHCATTQSYYVVGWQATADASYWYVEKVTLTSAQQTELDNIHTFMNTDYTSQLTTFFEDYACTTLKSTYASMTDANLRSAMSALPTAVQDMAVCVKNDTWNTAKDATWNAYEKDFRIHSYEIFSNCDLWYNKLKIGKFSHLFHPTGVKVNAGDYLYIYVGADVADSNASLEAEIVSGCDREGATITLHKGYNAVYAPKAGEVFVSYLLNNVDKLCTSYPDITVHIEGGTMNGCFDMRGHGHDNDDWAWLKSNMFSDTYLHVKGNSVMLNVYLASVTGESNAEGVMNIWDFIFDKLQSLSGCDSYKAAGKYKMMVNPFDNGTTGTNPFWSNGNHGSSHPGITSNGLFNYSKLSNVGTDGGQIWEAAHELAHGHQTPVNLAGQTESSNNSLVQCLNLLASENVGTNMFQTVRSSRGDGVKALVSRFNNGYSWIDLGSMRTQSGTYNDVWLSNKLLFQLWLYFDYLGNYQPTGGNTGFSFISALYEKMRTSGLVHSDNSSNPGLASKDYLLLAQYAAEITQTDLSEYFEAWGFWKLEPTVSVENDIAASSTWYMGDYYGYYVKTAQSYVNSVKNAMKSYTKKGGNIMFIEDRCTGSTLATYNGKAVSTFGETGYYETYSTSVTGTYKYSTSGTTVTVSGDGAGAVGFKVYDASGNLVAISNTKSFTVSSEVAAGLANGTYRMVAAQGDGSDVSVPSTGAKSLTYILKYNGTEVGRSENVMVIPNSSTEANMPDELKNLGEFGDWITYTYSPTTTTSTTTTVNVTATWNGPFNISTSYANATWYKLRQRADQYGIVGYPTYKANNTPNITMPGSYADNDSTKWAFVGNPYTGLTIMNKAAGSSLKLVSGDPTTDSSSGGDTYATMATSGTNETWFVKPSEFHYNGFFICNADGYAFNWRSYNYMAYWTDNMDRGSTFTVWDVSDFLPGVTDLANLSNYKSYIVTNARRTWLTNTDTEPDSLRTQVVFDPSNEYSRFAIITYDNKYYVFSVTAQKFLNATGLLTESPEPVSITATNNADYPWFFSFDSSHNLNVNSEGNVVINTWNQVDAGNSHAFVEIDDFDPTYALALLSNTVEVTFNLVYNGAVVKTDTRVLEKGATPSISDVSSWDNGLMTYTCDVSTITASTTTVNLTATWNGPFEIADDYTSAKWYTMKIKNANYPTYVSGGTPNVTLPTTATDDATQRWAFIGSPYTGLTIVNKAAGADVHMTSESPVGDGNTGGNTYVNLASSGTYQVWIPKASSYYTNAFFLFNSDGYALNQRSTANLAYWTGSYDAGSSFTVEEVPEDWSQNVINEVGPFMDAAGDYEFFGISAATKTAWQTKYDSYSTSPTTEAQYHEIKDAIMAAIVYPTEGNYRLKSNRSRYMTTADGSTVTTTTDADDANNVITLTGTYPNFTLTIGGKNVQQYSTYSVAATLSTDAGYSALFSLITPGHCIIQNGTASWLCMHEDAAYNVVGWYGADNPNSYWVLEAVAGVKIGDVNGDKHRTFADVTALVQYLTGHLTDADIDMDAANVNRDTTISLADVTALINQLLTDGED